MLKNLWIEAPGVSDRSIRAETSKEVEKMKNMRLSLLPVQHLKRKKFLSSTKPCLSRVPGVIEGIDGI